MASISAFSNPYPPASRTGSQRPMQPLPTVQTSPSPPTEAMPLSAYTDAIPIPQTPQDLRTIGMAKFLLGRIQNLPADEAYLRGLGINIVFHNGQDALRVINSKGIKVEFGNMGDTPAHAQWVPEQNRIMINQRYRNDTSAPTLYAIAEAIYHEAGHAAQLVTNPRTGQPINLTLLSNNPAAVGDGESSLQEEVDCLALNTLAHRYHEAINPKYAEANSSSPLLANGVALYSKLFFDPDPAKTALVNRVIEKYGDLSPTSLGHEIPTATLSTPIVLRILQRLQQSALPANCAMQANQVNAFPMAAPAPALNIWA